MDRQLVLSEAGEVYQRKRPLSQQALFWTSLVLGGFALILFGLMTTYWNQKQAMESALRRQGLYYDSFTQDIYQDEVQEEGSDWSIDLPTVRERLTEANLNLVEQMELTPEQLTLSAIEPALLDLEGAVSAYLADLSIYLEDLYDLGELFDEDYAYYTEQLAAYEEAVSDHMKTIRDLYQAKENGHWSERDKSILADHLADLLNPDVVIFDDTNLQTGVSI